MIASLIIIPSTNTSRRQPTFTQGKHPPFPPYPWVYWTPVDINIIELMIVLPWFVRFGLDCTVALTPLVYFHYHPSTFLFEYFQNRRRIVRRQSFEKFEYLSPEPTLEVGQVKALYEELGIEA